MIAGGAAHAAASVVGADIHVLRPLRAREAVDQPLPVVLLIFFAEVGVGFPAVVAGANAVLLILRILWRQVAVSTWRRAASRGVVGIWLTWPPTG